MDKIRKISFGVVSSAIGLLLLAAPALAASIEISGNGADSDNSATVDQTSSTVIVQENSSDFTNNVRQRGNTGRNRANSNTGGDVDIDTGDASNSADVTNTGGGNSATIKKAPPDLPNVDIKDNGAGSTNTAGATWTDSTVGVQENSCTKSNRLRQRGRTGRNRANNNTGGTVKIKTGKVTNNKTVTNTCDPNTLVIEPSPSPSPSP